MAIVESYLTQKHDDFILVRRWICVIAQICLMLSLCSGMGFTRLGFRGFGIRVFSTRMLGDYLAKHALLSDSGLDHWLVALFSKIIQRAIP